MRVAVAFAPKGPKHVSPGQSAAPPWEDRIASPWSPEGAKQDSLRALCRPFRVCCRGRGNPGRRCAAGAASLCPGLTFRCPFGAKTWARETAQPIPWVLPAVTERESGRNRPYRCMPQFLVTPRLPNLQSSNLPPDASQRATNPALQNGLGMTPRPLFYRVGLTNVARYQLMRRPRGADS